MSVTSMFKNSACGTRLLASSKNSSVMSSPVTLKPLSKKICLPLPPAHPMSPTAPPAGNNFINSLISGGPPSAMSCKYFGRSRPYIALIAPANLLFGCSIRFEIALHARDDGCLTRDKLLACNLPIHLNIAAGELFYKLRWCVWERRVFVGVAIFLEPQAQEFFVEALGLFPFCHSLFIAFHLPIAGGIWCVNFVYQNQRTWVACPERSRGVSAEFVLRIHQDEPALRGNFLPARKELRRRFPHLVHKLFRDEPLGYHLLLRDDAVVALFFGRRVKDGMRKLLILFHAVRQCQVAEYALTVRIARPNGRIRNAGQITPHHRLDRHHLHLLRHCHVRVGYRNDGIRDDILCLLNPPGAYLIELLPLPGNMGDDAVEG